MLDIKLPIDLLDIASATGIDDVDTVDAEIDGVVSFALALARADNFGI